MIHANNDTLDTITPEEQALGKLKLVEDACDRSLYSSTSKRETGLAEYIKEIINEQPSRRG